MIFGGKLYGETRYMLAFGGLTCISVFVLIVGKCSFRLFSIWWLVETGGAGH
jgi:hypothetical protein